MRILERICAVCTSGLLALTGVTGALLSPAAFAEETPTVWDGTVDTSLNSYISDRTAVDIDDTQITYEITPNSGDLHQLVTQSNESVAQVYTASDSAIATEMADSTIYNMLETTAEKDFYQNLLECFESVDNSTDDYTGTPYVRYSGLSSDRAIEVAWLFHYDHPEYFWCSSSLSGYYNVLSFDIYSDYQDGLNRALTKVEIETIEQEYIDAALTYDTAYDRAKYLYSALRNDIDYQEGDHDQSIASAFLEKQTVCAGYSLAYELLCKAVGIDAIVVSSPVHGWNEICLSGNWYIVDVTNGYFLLSTDEMHEKDVNSGNSYKRTTTSGGTVVKTETFYMHDIDTTKFATYADSFPVCDTSYNNIDGKESISDNLTVTTTTEPFVTTTTTTATTKPATSEITADRTTTSITETTTTTTSAPPATTTESATTTITTTTAKPATTTTTDTTPQPTSIKGDADSDGNISAQDAYLVLLYYSMRLAGDSSYTLTGDVEQDETVLPLVDIDDSGDITTQDAYYILLYYSYSQAGKVLSWDEIMVI